MQREKEKKVIKNPICFISYRALDSTLLLHTNGGHKVGSPGSHHGASPWGKRSQTDLICVGEIDELHFAVNVLLPLFDGKVLLIRVLGLRQFYAAYYCAESIVPKGD